MRGEAKVLSSVRDWQRYRKQRVEVNGQLRTQPKANTGVPPNFLYWAQELFNTGIKGDEWIVGQN